MWFRFTPDQRTWFLWLAMVSLCWFTTCFHFYQLPKGMACVSFLFWIAAAEFWFVRIPKSWKMFCVLRTPRGALGWGITMGLAWFIPYWPVVAYVCGVLGFIIILTAVPIGIAELRGDRK